MRRVLKISENDFEKVRRLLLADLPRESAAFLLVGWSSLRGQEAFLVRRVVEIPKDQFTVQESYRLGVSSRAINGIIALCEGNALGVVLCHNHPDTTPYSASDDFGEKRVAETIWTFLPAVPVGSLLLRPDGPQGRAWLPNPTRAVDLNEIVVIGRSVWRHPLGSNGNGAVHIDHEIYDRQVAVLGEKGQQKISSARVAVVGVGGTGSATAEQLVRLGAKDIVLVDNDVFSPSNKSRLYGSFEAHARHSWYAFWERNRPKVAVVANHLRKIQSALKIRTYAAHVAATEACRSLLDRDVIFLCTDDHWGRSVVNQVAYQYLIPVINMGVRIDSDNGKITEAVASVHILRPEKPCLWCSNYLRAEQIQAESLPETERHALEREGYVQGLDMRAPSVISFTTWVSAIATSLFIQLMTDFMGVQGDLARVNVFFNECATRRGTCQVLPDCICTKVKGFGDCRPLPTVASPQLPRRSRR